VIKFYAYIERCRLGAWFPKGIAVTAVVDVFHVGEVVLDIDDLILDIPRLGLAILIRAFDVIDPWKGIVVFDILVDVLRVLCGVINCIVINDTDASNGFLLDHLMLTVFTVVHKVIVFCDGDI
jgi:hypothetical protein